MPGSYPTFKREVARHINEVCGDSVRILDLGAGAGVWADLLGHGRLDAVEIWAPYIEQFKLREKYGDMMVTDAVGFPLARWDYIIAGDLLEHLTPRDAQAIIREACRVESKLLVAVPYRCAQDDVGGNPYEQHVQADLTPEIMAERYPELRLLIGDERYGYYVNYETPMLAPDPPRVPVVWFFGDRGYWDHGLLIHAMDGTLWPTPRPFLYAHHERHEQIGAAGCLGIVAGRWRTAFAHDLETFVGQRAWSLIVNVSDEECIGPWGSALHPNSLVWVQTPDPCASAAMARDGTGWGRPRRGVPLGWRTDTRAVAMDPPISVPPPQRPHLWAFAGQGYNNPVRLQCMQVLEALRHAEPFTVTDRFGGGLPYRAFLEQLAATSIVPCPSGPSTPDTFRLWEALELGCLPVANAHGPSQRFRMDYFAELFQVPPEEIPFPRLDSWEEFPALVDAYRNDPARLSRDMSRAFAWWQGRKRQFVLDLEDDLHAVSGLAPPGAGGLRSQVTVLIPTSPVRLHPSTVMIEDTIARIRAYPELAECEILIMIDGIRPEQEHYRDAYEEYIRRLLWLCNWDPRHRGCLPLLFHAHTHQAGMTRRALELVRTPLVLFVEHDTWPFGDIEWAGMAQALDEPGVNAIRLHIFDRVLEEHRDLYGSERQEIAGVPLLKTSQWSQRPHLARAEWYREIIRAHFDPDDRAMIEDRVIGYAANEDWGLWIYAPDGSLLRSGTCDGRGDDPKWSDDGPAPGRSAIEGLKANAQAREQRCDAGHVSHEQRTVTVTLSGPSAVREYPAIPAHLARYFDLDIYDAKRYMGFKGYCTGQDEMSLSIIENGIWEGFETRLVMEILAREDRDSLVLDFGAHIGWYTLLAVSFGYQVRAFEADPENVEMLYMNLIQNGLATGVNTREGWIDDRTPPLHLDPGRRIALLKSDLEGSEDHVERMCRDLFRDHRIRFALLEISPCFKAHYPDTVMRIADAGYWAYDVPSKLCEDTALFSRDPLAYLRQRRIITSDLQRYVLGLTQSTFLFALPEAMGDML